MKPSTRRKQLLLFASKCTFVREIQDREIQESCKARALTGTSTLRNMLAPLRASISAMSCGVETITAPAHQTGPQKPQPKVFEIIKSEIKQDVTKGLSMITEPVLLHNYKRAKQKKSSTLLTRKAMMSADGERKLGQER